MESWFPRPLVLIILIVVTRRVGHEHVGCTEAAVLLRKSPEFRDILPLIDGRWRPGP